MSHLRLQRGLAIVIVLTVLGVAWSQQGVAPVTVKFHEPKTVVSDVERTGPVDPTVRIKIQASSGMAFGLTADGIRLTFSSASVRTMFKIDDQLVYPNQARPTPLPAKKKSGLPPHGFTSTFIHKNVHITHIVEAVPTRPVKSGDKRRIDAAMVRYFIENKDTQAHTLALRVRFDTYCNNDGALFAAPTMPNKILDGLELKDKTLPPFVQILQVPNLKSPVNMGHFTLKLGNRMIGPDRFVCTAHGAGENGWEVMVRKAMGDSDCVMYWKPVTLQPGSKVTLAYAYGKGLARTPEAEGRFNIAFGGSFEPGKLFTIAAHVNDPLGNQTIALDLPDGMELVEGKRLQPVPAAPEDFAASMVLWKCRVKELGEHTIRFRSSNGITQTRTITVARP